MRPAFVFIPLAVPIAGMLAYFLPHAARIPVFLFVVGAVAAFALVAKERRDKQKRP